MYIAKTGVYSDMVVLAQNQHEDEEKGTSTNQHEDEEKCTFVGEIKTIHESVVVS